MAARQLVTSAAAVVVSAVIVTTGILINSPRVRARSDGDDQESRQESRIERGFDIAPVPLNLDGKNRALVGLGSYLVNAVADCNGCHSAGPPSEFANGGNPYFLSPPFSGKKKINPATYLGGGRDFGPIGSVPHLYSRNLTPDKTGLPEGGRTYEQFVKIMRRGTDFDHVHPNCTAPGTPANCFEPPFNGALLQVLPWPIHQNMTHHDLRAIYEYLSAIPCIEGPPAPSLLHNDCPVKPDDE